MKNNNKIGETPKNDEPEPGIPASGKTNGSESGVNIPTADKKSKTKKEKKPGNAKRKKGNDTMQPFAAGDVVVAVNTDMSAPILPDVKMSQYAFEHPDGPLKNDVTYQVTMVCLHSSGHQGVFLRGLRVIRGPGEIPWHHSRFMKV
jgi:hypothetical protein